MGLNLIGKIELDGAGFERGLRRAGDSVTGFVKSAAVAAFGFYGVEQAIQKTVETAGELVNEAKRLDMTVEQLQLLREAAKQGGTEMDTLAGKFEELDIARAKALAGDKDVMLAFTRLGVTPDQLKNKTAADIFTGPLSAAAKNNNVESIAPALKEIFGKGFGELLPVLKTDFEELGGTMSKLGSIMDTETAVKLKALGNNFELLKNILAVGIAPVLLAFVESIFTLIGKIKGAAAFWGTIVQHFTDLQPSQAKPEVLTSSGKINFWKEMWAEMFDGGAAKPDVKNISPVAAAKAAEEEWTNTIDELRKKLDSQAKDLEHPKPVIPDLENTTRTGRSANVPSDALVKVGNFLGQNGHTINRVEQHKIQLLTRIANAVEKQSDIKSSFGNFGLGIPTP